MDDPLQRLAALASTLSCAELRTLHELTAAASNESVVTRQSTRHIATRTGLASSNVVNAIHSLSKRGLIRSDGGTTRRPAQLELAYLAVEMLPIEPRSATV